MQKETNTDEEKKRAFINVKSNRIAEDLLEKHYSLHERVSNDFEVAEYSFHRSEIIYHKLKQDFKEKEKEWLKMT